MELRRACVQEVEENIERQKIVDRADRTDKDHEIPDQADVPMLGFAHVGFVYVVGRNCDLGHVIKKVIEKDLCRQHGKKRQKQRGSSHAQHVAEVGTGAHQQVLHDIAESLAALQNSVMQDAQARL